jgi:protein-L-isoaspartate(D-aspartate) O-methyltransferase
METDSVDLLCMKSIDSMAELRALYAEEIRAVGDIRSERLIRAFATVPREAFLGPGPWSIVRPDGRYRQTSDSNPKHLYHNVLVGLDDTRHLNTGHPSSVAQWLDSFSISEGERVFHVGCGVGYYTAIIAHLVGQSGQVVAIEADEMLASRARANLADFHNVAVVSGDGTLYDPGSVDIIFVSAGVTHPLPFWLDCLSLGGRLLCPVTASSAADDADFQTRGFMLLTVHTTFRIYTASYISPANFFPCLGARFPAVNSLLEDALLQHPSQIRCVRRDKHDQVDSCWLHTDTVCLSTVNPFSLPNA